MLFSDKKFHTCAFPPSLPLSACDNIAFLLCLNDVTLIWEKEQNQLVLWQNTEKVSIHWSQWKRCSKKSAIILMMVKLKKCTFVNTIFILINDFLFFLLKTDILLRKVAMSFSLFKLKHKVSEKKLVPPVVRRSPFFMIPKQHAQSLHLNHPKTNAFGSLLLLFS